MASSSTLDGQVITAHQLFSKTERLEALVLDEKQFATVKGVGILRPSTAKQPPTVDNEPSDTDSEGKWKKWEIKTNAQNGSFEAASYLELDLDVRLRLKTLQDHFKITNQQQILELSAQYADVQQKRKNQNVEAWLDEYSRISSLCQSEDMAEMKAHAHSGPLSTPFKRTVIPTGLASISLL
ncbi:hypothetical protein P3342_004326 [Pyrenophora teres f. teres]|nr:hypothetical protein P3342_004326 [Pyrenophora teres f. teres]